LIAHYNLNPIFDSAINEVNLKVDQVNNLVNQINNLITQVPPSVNLDSSKIQSGITDLINNVNFYAGQLSSITSGRFALVYFSCSLAIITGIIGCVYVHSNNGCLFEWFCAFAMILVFGSCVTITVLYIVSDITSDTCNELYYRDGVLELWQSQLVHDIQVIDEETLDPQITNDTDNACNDLQNLCELPCCTNTCGACNTYDIVDYLNRTINDNGQTRTVSGCATQCNNTNLRSTCSNIVIDDKLIQYWLTFQNTLNELTQPITDPNLIIQLRGLVCYVSAPIDEIWVGCAFFIFGSCIMGVFCLLLRGRRDTEEEELQE